MNNLKEQTLFDKAISEIEKVDGKAYTANRKWQRRKELVNAYKSRIIKLKEELKKECQILNERIAGIKTDNKTVGIFYTYGTFNDTSNDFYKVWDKYNDIKKLKEKIQEHEELFSLLFAKMPADVTIYMEGEAEIIGEEPQLLLETK